MSETKMEEARHEPVPQETKEMQSIIDAKRNPKELEFRHGVEKVVVDLTDYEAINREYDARERRRTFATIFALLVAIIASFLCLWSERNEQEVGVLGVASFAGIMLGPTILYKTVEDSPDIHFPEVPDEVFKFALIPGAVLLSLVIILSTV